MATKNENIEKESVTGLDTATNRKDAEYDLVASLLKAAEFKTSEENVHAANIRRNGELLFTINLHPVGDNDIRTARKKATTYMPHPNGKKFGQIEKDFNNSVFGSWVIYLATTDEDQQRIWGNASVMQKLSLVMPYESVDLLLTAGEKRKVLDLVLEISGIDDEDEDEGNMDEETFQ